MLKRFSSFIVRFKWVVIICWAVLLAVVLVFAPALSDVARSNQESFLPKSSEAVKASELLKELFPDKGGNANLVLAFERKEGLRDGDREYAKKLEAYLIAHKDSYKVYEVTSPFTNKDIESYMISKDNKAAIVNVSLSIAGFTEVSKEVISSIRDDLKSSRKSHKYEDTPQVPDGLNIYLTGDAAIAQEEQETVNKSMEITGMITVILVALVLIAIYRSPVAFILPLLTIGISFLISRGIVAAIAGLGLEISSFTETFLIAVLFGAGTDYCLLIISRFREELALGKSVQEAVQLTMPKTGEAIISSGGTVIIGFSFMYFAKFGLYRTTGPSVAIGVAITLLAVITLVPAILSMTGESIFWPFHPSRTRTVKSESRLWIRISRLVTFYPIRFIIVCCVVFAPFVISAGYINLTFDQLGELPSTKESVKGFQIIKDHMDQGMMLPVSVTMKTDKNVWDNASLQVVDKIADNIMKIDNVSKVMTATRLQGVKEDRLTMPYILEEMSNSLNNADLVGLEKVQRDARQMSGDLESKTAEFDKLINGTAQTVSGISRVNGELRKISKGLEALILGLKDLNKGIVGVNKGVGSSKDGLGKVNDALKSIRSSLEKLSVSQPAIAQDTDFQTAYGTVEALIPNVDKLYSGLAAVQGGLGTMADSESGAARIIANLEGVRSGINIIVSNLDRVKAGLEELQEGQRKAREELLQYSGYIKNTLSGLGTDNNLTGFDKESIDSLRKVVDEYNVANNKMEAPFIITGEAFKKEERLRPAMQEYISPDGKGTYLKVILSTPPYTKESLDSIAEIRRTVQDTLNKSHLDGAEFYIGGPTAIFSEVRDITSEDFIKVITFVLLGIFIILCILLRSFIAPIYLLLTILLSYATTMGISHLVFKYLMGYDGLSWSTTFFAFCLLVALGVDYNIFLMSRVKEEYKPGDNVGGVSRALITTGGIITSCGIIMAGTFGALLASPIKPLFEVGFAAVVGLLLDTFIVRSLLVPAIAVKVGELNWWPGRKIKIVAVTDKEEAKAD